MTHTPISGGHLLVRCLQSLGARVCFGVPGESYLDVLDALHDSSGELDFKLCRNEGGAAFMAESYGKLTGIPGLCLVTRGPGATNASIGVHTALQNSSPMILLIGQVGTGLLGREAFQEIDYVSFFGSVAKLAIQIDRVDRIPELIARAWSTALSGRPGPVVVSLPEDMLVSSSTSQPCKPVSIPEAAPRQSDIDELTSLLNSAARPLIIVGGGSWSSEAKRALQLFAEHNCLPVLSAFRFNDLIDNYSDCYIGNAGVGMAASIKKTVADADVIVAIGARLGEMTTAEYSLLQVPQPSTRLVHAHASDKELGKIYTADLAIHSGPNQMAFALQSVQLDCRWQSWTHSARQAYLDGFRLPVQPGPVDMVAVTASIQQRLPDDVIVTNGAGNFTVWPNKFLKYGPDQRLLAPQSGAMGYGLPAAIAAKIVAPEKVVICFAGDGDFQMNCQELGTAMQCDARPIVLLLNNGTYGTIRMHQERHYPGRISATDLVNPDFVALARSYGFHAETVNETSNFEAAFDRALASRRGALIELIISAEAITPYETLSQIRDSASQ